MIKIVKQNILVLSLVKLELWLIASYWGRAN